MKKTSQKRLIKLYLLFSAINIPIIIQSMFFNSYKKTHKNYYKPNFYKKSHPSVKIFVPKKKSGLMHHKFAIINEKIIIDGSFNWSRAANEKNEENIEIQSNKEKINSFQSYFKTLLNRCNQWLFS